MTTQKQLTYVCLRHRVSSSFSFFIVQLWILMLEATSLLNHSLL